MVDQSSQTVAAGPAAALGVVITRVFDAPRELVWRAWTEPKRMMKWWGPKGFTSPVCTMDLRVGGKFHFCMRSPDGKDYWNTGVYLEVLPFERLVYTDSFADEHGNMVPATYYGLGADFPAEALVTMTLVENQGKTTMIVRHAGIPSGEMTEMTTAGWNQSFEKLAATLR